MALKQCSYCWAVPTELCCSCAALGSCCSCIACYSTYPPPTRSTFRGEAFKLLLGFLACVHHRRVQNSSNCLATQCKWRCRPDGSHDRYKNTKKYTGLHLLLRRSSSGAHSLSSERIRLPRWLQRQSSGTTTIKQLKLNASMACYH